MKVDLRKIRTSQQRALGHLTLLHRHDPAHVALIRRFIYTETDMLIAEIEQLRADNRRLTDKLVASAMAVHADGDR